MNEPTNDEIMADIRDSVDAAFAMKQQMLDRIKALEGIKNLAYQERNLLIVALSKCFPAYLAIDEKAEQGWQTVVFISFQGKQATWHISDHDIPLFGHLKIQENDWDGHTTDEKYARISALSNLRIS